MSHNLIVERITPVQCKFCNTTATHVIRNVQMMERLHICIDCLKILVTIGGEYLTIYRGT